MNDINMIDLYYAFNRGIVRMCRRRAKIQLFGYVKKIINLMEQSKKIDGGYLPYWKIQQIIQSHYGVNLVMKVVI